MSEQEAVKTKSTMVLKEDETQVVLDWHRWLHGEKQKGIRAQLKRCSSLDDVITAQGFLRLNQMLPRLQKIDPIVVALISGVLAVIRESEGIQNIENDDFHKRPELLELLGNAKEGGDRPVFSELRFQRLLAADDEEQLYRHMRRAVAQAGDKKPNPVALANNLIHRFQEYHWGREHCYPDWYRGSLLWQYHAAKSYYTEVFKYQKGV